MRSVHHAGVVMVLLGLPGLANAESGFARPPAGESWVPDHAPVEPEPQVAEVAEDPPAHESNLRLAVGPVLRVSEPATDAGLGASVDVGAGAVGVRLAGNWVRVGSDRGLSEYQAELWVDFADGGRLHPILGAGAGLARLASEGAGNESYGVGVLRGTLEYVLPVPRADARAAIDLSGHVPAMHGRSAPDADPWLLIGARVGVGF
jgi:hypothetical protein